MFKHKKIIVTIGALLTLTTSLFIFASEYIPSNRDTKMEPEPFAFEAKKVDEFSLLYENDTFKYLFKDDNDVMAVVDKRNGYVWTTGLDIPFDKDVEKAIDKAIDEGKTPEYTPLEDRLNTTYTGMANSLITVEYYDESQNIKRTSSAAYKSVKSNLKKFDDNHYRLDIAMNDIDVDIKVHIYLDESGVTYEIKDEEISGEGTDVLAAVLISPFLGASGGQKLYWNEVDQKFNIEKPNEMIPGYVLVPDGSGALIRFDNHNTQLKEYVGDVYGTDPSKAQFYYDEQQGYIPLKNPTMPVFGIALGDRQNAFCAYAIEGAEYMEIVTIPEENMTFYTWAYPRFVYNNLYFQVYNKKGDGFFTLAEERNHFNVNIHYAFLEGDGSNGTIPADYVGMARTYRDYLIKNDLLKGKSNSQGSIPLRLDFIMSDSKKSVIGFEDSIVTTANEAKDILLEISESGITNINSGLYGWQKGGISLQKPWKADWSSDIGSKTAFKALVAETAAKGIDVSLAQNYVWLDEKQIKLNTQAAKHINGWYNRYYVDSDQFPIDIYSYAKPSLSATWLEKQTKLLEEIKVSSLTIDGITNLLVSDYGKKPMTVTDTMALYEETLSKVGENHKIGAQTPNAYLWQYVDRFLKTPVFSSQFLVETDTVPFLQLVLAGEMELYAPYSNFSFYTQGDILRMIDYNVYPSFVLTKESSHLLAKTNSSEFYTTEYALYKESIQTIYNKVNNGLAKVQEATWIDRQVLQPGVIMNDYDNGVKIIINYTDQVIKTQDGSIEPMNYLVIE